MCGIVGKVGAGRPVEEGLMARMCSALEHRGPDSRGVFERDGVGLGIQRLRVIDLETGDQPVYNEDGTIVVVLNGEIYNYRELRADLARRGHRLATNGDTETIVHLYEELGPDCVRKLDGMFAFALWDSRRRRLLLARDRVGKKPLFYWHHAGSLGFASELAAAIIDPETPREIDPDAVDGYLAYGYVPAPLSIWRGVKKLPPASTLLFEPGVGEPRIERYWRLDYSHKLKADTADLELELRRLIGAAVRRRMIADVPLGAFLSGGVDSAIVVSEMAKASSDPVKTFTIGSEVASYNETPGARRVAERFGTDHHELIVRPDAIELMPSLVRHYGEPFADTSSIPSFYVAEFARRHVTVALNGDGGDEDFAGYLRHAANAIAPVARMPMVARRALARAGGLLPSGSRTTASRANQLLTSLDQEPLERYRRHVSVFTHPERERLLDPAFVHRVDTSFAAEVIGRPWREASGADRLDVTLEVDVLTYLPDDLLVKMDIATMAHSLEARSPLLDPQVMEFAAALPADRKLHRMRKKWILRRAYRDIIPSEILSARKRGFAVPIAEWLRDELQDYSKDVLLDPRTLGRGYFRPAEVERLLDRHRARRADHSLQIWSLLMLEQWHRSFVDADAPATAVPGAAKE